VVKEEKRLGRKKRQVTISNGKGIEEQIRKDGRRVKLTAVPDFGERAVWRREGKSEGL